MPIINSKIQVLKYIPLGTAKQVSQVMRLLKHK